MLVIYTPNKFKERREIIIIYVTILSNVNGWIVVLFL